MPNQKKLFKPDLIVFDLDNTLYDYELVNRRATEQLIINLNSLTNIEPSVIKEMFLEAKKIVKMRLGATASSHSKLLYIAEFYRVANIRPAIKEILNLENLYWNVFINEMKIESGVEEFLLKTRHQNIKLVLLTDLTSLIQYKKLIKLGLDNTFDLILTSEDCGGDKITLKPYEVLSELINDDIDNIWYVGDSPSDFNESLSVRYAFYLKKSKRLKYEKCIYFRNFKQLNLFLEKVIK